MSYILLSILYFALCFMVLGMYPGHEIVIDAVMGTISVIAFKIIEFSAYVAGKPNNNTIIDIGFNSIPYVKAVGFCIIFLWVALMIWLFVNRAEKLQTQGQDIEYAKGFKL
ncbi:membrane protein [Candidatus Magnetomorum sp. HK-1]|nr:membrane protein [Candidatus Magnetomorum sp. HK-1]